jgi:hypothetical protein
MDRTPVKSSNISSVGYDPETSTLEIQFKSGGIYRYAGVDSDTHTSLMGAESIGKFFHQHIVRGGFNVEKVDLENQD